ncbi:MAG: hypothetical protein RIR70_683 [Pseudomonadota bacterium]|jgi:acetyl esterase/lipase
MTMFSFLLRGPRALGALLLGVLSGCSPVSMLNALVPHDTYQRTRALPYGDLPRQKLDVYVPAQGARDAPVVVFFYGGSWESGSREDYRFVGEALSSLGAVALVADYRIYPEARFPVFLQDAAQAVKWAAHNAPTFGGDANRLFVMGHSAGAHIALMLATDSDYLAAVGMQPQQLRGAIGLAGPYDFLPLSSDRLKEIFGPETNWPRSQPVNFVRGQEPPMLLATGDADDIVKPKNTASLAARVRAAGGQVKEITYPKAGHVSIVVDLSSPFRGRSPVWQDVAAFIRETSGNPLAAR